MQSRTRTRGRAGWRRILVRLVLATVVLGLAAAEAEAVDAKYRNQIRTARRFLMRGQGVEAAQIYREVLKQHPGDEQAASGLAQSLIAQEAYDEAEKFLEEALETVEPTINLYRKREELRRLQGRPDDAFADALRVLGENEGLAPWVFSETRELLKEGLNPGKARGHAESELEKHPDNLNFAVLTAVILALDERHEDAMELMVETDARKRRNGQTIMRYAEELLALGDRPRALDAMAVAAESSTKSSRRTQILFTLAELLDEDARYDDALARLDVIAAEREGTSAAGKALIRSAEIYQNRLDDPRGALTVYERLETDPSLGHYRPEMLLQMGDCYVQLGNFDRARAVYQSVIPEAIDPEHAETAAFRLAETAFYRGDADSALVLYQDMAEAYARSLLTDDAAGRYILLNSYTSLGGGEALSLLGRMEWGVAIGDSAITDSTARTLIDRYPESELAAEAWLARAELAITAGQYAVAVEHLEHVVTEHAANRRAAVALRRQGDLLLEKLDRPQEALSRYERILTDYPDSVLSGEVRRRVEAVRRGLKS